jgi:hypothetical protein
VTRYQIDPARSRIDVTARPSLPGARLVVDEVSGSVDASAEPAGELTVWLQAVVDDDTRAPGLPAWLRGGELVAAEGSLDRVRRDGDRLEVALHLRLAAATTAPAATGPGSSRRSASPSSTPARSASPCPRSSPTPCTRAGGSRSWPWCPEHPRDARGPGPVTLSGMRPPSPALRYLRRAFRKGRVDVLRAEGDRLAETLVPDPPPTPRSASWPPRRRTWRPGWSAGRRCPAPAPGATARPWGR